MDKKLDWDESFSPQDGIKSGKIKEELENWPAAHFPGTLGWKGRDLIRLITIFLGFVMLPNLRMLHCSSLLVPGKRRQL